MRPFHNRKIYFAIYAMSLYLIFMIFFLIIINSFLCDPRYATTLERKKTVIGGNSRMHVGRRCSMVSLFYMAVNSSSRDNASFLTTLTNFTVGISTYIYIDHPKLSFLLKKNITDILICIYIYVT